MGFGDTHRSLWKEILSLSQGLSLACLFIKDASFVCKPPAECNTRSCQALAGMFAVPMFIMTGDCLTEGRATGALAGAKPLDFAVKSDGRGAGLGFAVHLADTLRSRRSQLWHEVLPRRRLRR